jgi:hypothetical protein
MTKITLFMINVVLYITLLLLINACGGAGDANNESGGGGDNPTPVDGNVNGGLSGHIFMHDGWMIDIPTGKGERVPGVVWDDFCFEQDFNDDVSNDFFCVLSNPEIDYGNGVSFGANPSISGDEYLLTASNCVYGHGYSNSDCIEVRSVDTGKVIGERLIRYEIINSGAKFSRNGQYYAYSHNDDKVFSETSFIINSKNHEEITSIRMQKNDPMPFDWGPSGEIVLAYDGALYITPPYSLDGVRILDLRDHPELNTETFHVTGFGGTIRVSPDGSQIAFMLFDGTHSSLSYIPMTPWVINADGTDLHRLAYADTYSDSELFGSLAWSPDGSYILVTEGYHPAPDGGGGSGHGYLYAIPSDSRGVMINKDGANGVILMHTNYRELNQEVRSKFNGNIFWWLP